MTILLTGIGFILWDYLIVCLFVLGFMAWGALKGAQNKARAEAEATNAPSLEWIGELAGIINRCRAGLVKAGAGGYKPWLTACAEKLAGDNPPELEDAIRATATAIARTAEEIKAGGHYDIEPLRKAARELNSFELHYLGAGE